MGSFGSTTSHIMRTMAIESTVMAGPLAPLIPFSVKFTEGFGAGLISRSNASSVQTVASKIRSEPLGFYRGYCYGFLVGVLGGLQSLFEMLVKIVPYTLPTAPLFLGATLLHEVYREVRYNEHRKMRLRQLHDIGITIRHAKAMAEAVLQLLGDIQARPTLYMAKTQHGGRLLGEEMAVYLGAVVAASAAEIGVFAGRIVGRVAFEIVLIIATEGIGAAARGIRTGLQGEEIVGRLTPRLIDRLEGLSAIRGRFLGHLDRGLEGALNAADMKLYLQAIWSRTPVLQRLARAGRMTVEAQQRAELMEILGQFRRETGIVLDIVPDNTIQASRGTGNLASLRSRPGWLQIERMAYDDTPTLMNEVRHELAYHYAGGPGGVPTLGEGPFNALELLEIMVEEGGRMPANL